MWFRKQQYLLGFNNNEYLISVGLGWLFAELLLQHPNQNQQATSGVGHVISPLVK